jgi:maltose O-acetyltransferase
MRLFSKIKYWLFVKPKIVKFNVLSSCKKVEGKPILNQPLLTNGKGSLHFGKKVTIGVEDSPYFYSTYAYFEARYKESQIIIGNNVFINNNCSIEASSAIEIHDDVLIGVNCNFLDSDGHALASNKRITGIPTTKPIIIEKNVFIGDHVTILKGVTVGENSVIGNGSMVTKDVPKNVIVAGNPAIVIKKL